MSERRSLEDALRRLDADPEDPALLVEGRRVLARVAPQDRALRSRLAAAGIRQQPEGERSIKDGRFGRAPHPGLGGATRLSPDGRSLLTSDNFWDAGEYGSGPLLCKVTVWGIASGASICGPHECGQLERDRELIHGFSSNGRKVLLGQPENIVHELRLCDLHDKAEVSLPRSERSVRRPEAVAVADLMAAGSSKGAIVALADGAQVEVIRCEPDGRLQRVRSWGCEVEALAFDPGGLRLAALRYDGAIEIRRVEDGARIGGLIDGRSRLSSLRWGPRDRLYGLSPDSVFIDAVDRSSFDELRLERFEPRGLAFDAAGEVVITGDAQGQIVFWDSSTEEALSVVEGLPPLADIALDEEGGHILAVFEDRSLRSWLW